MKMHHHKNLLLFILSATLLSIHFPCFVSSEKTVAYAPLQPNHRLCNRAVYGSCIGPAAKMYKSHKCPKLPFDCGSISYIRYPFWAEGSSNPCSRPGVDHGGFKLVCEGDVPMLNISSLSYQVKVINFDTNTLKVVREDLWNSPCPEVFHNTTMDPNLFAYLPESNDQNVTLYFNCTSTDQKIPPNQFKCSSGDYFNTLNVFKIGNALSGPGLGITCSKNIFVPVKSEAAESLKNPTPSSVNILKDALRDGFYLTWQEDEDSQSPAPAPQSKYSNSRTGNDLGNSPPPMATILVVISGITGLVIIFIIIYCFHKRRRLLQSPNHGRNQDIEIILLQHGSLAPKRYKYSQIKKITKSFSDKLGQGGYGSVYKGILPNGCLVAVKVLVQIDSNGEEFINEVASISRTSHVNIVNLLGFCYDRNKRALVYEFMPNKSLDKFISSSGCCQLDKEKLYKIALGVAKGLEYLHTGCNTRIVHFDIKPQNILLDQDFCPKISDFGLAKLCKKKQSILSMIGARGTIGYIAPEIFSRNFGGVSHKSDVYSYGMMVLEMAGARNIVETATIRSSENYFPDKIYEEVILDVTRKLEDCMIEEEDDRTRKMFLVGFWCIQTTPSNRPSMSKVVEMLEGSLQSIQIPPKPFLFSPELEGQEFSSSLSAHAETEKSMSC
ncbi:Serine/threonine protein kinase [Handroanthus impetiginosus]|uniref:Serine/threonine protein kinase n=1 Tax=Handroanthus impetiginosus TaxID=429701 RepID=A0A2G9I4U8_9LAMI|nr:Serine/threonine protein kinase [Handroanthus impetiginosus]